LEIWGVVNEVLDDVIMGQCILAMTVTHLWLAILVTSGKHKISDTGNVNYSDKQRTMTHVRIEVFMMVTMKNAVFWDVTPCGSCKNQCFGGIS
jgi:hypothetical protein